MYFYIVPTKKDAQHHGVLGMKWGVRRYQNKDGSLTSRGKRRLGIGSSWNGVTYKEQYKAKNTNNSGISKKGNIFSEENNLKIVNKLLKDRNNCSLCTFAFDLRNRGIDVRAGGSNTSRDGQSHREIESWYEGNRKFKQNDAYYNESKMFSTEFKNKRDANLRLEQADKSFKQEIMNQGNGTSGHLSLGYREYDNGKEFAGHDVFYKVENGDIYIYDAQVGQKIKYDHYFSGGCFYILTDKGPKEMTRHPRAYLRTDDLTPKVDTYVTGSSHAPDKTVYGDISEKYVGPAAVRINTPKYNYSPATVSEKIETKPFNYTPPYKSKSELELLLEDVSYTYNKVKKKINNTIMNVNKGINTFKNTISKYYNALYWKIF